LIELAQTELTSISHSFMIYFICGETDSTDCHRCSTPEYTVRVWHRSQSIT